MDFQKAFDSLAREKIWQVLRSYGIPEKFVHIIKNWHNNSQSVVIYEGKISDWFKITTGVKQGCVISGLIFIIVLDWVKRRTWKNKVEFDAISTLPLRIWYYFADDYCSDIKHLDSHAKENI